MESDKIDPPESSCSVEVSDDRRPYLVNFEYMFHQSPGLVVRRIDCLLLIDTLDRLPAMHIIRLVELLAATRNGEA